MNDKPTKDGNQGEGDRTSARGYARRVREFVATGKVDPAAREAEAFVEQQPGEAARAEHKARRGPEPTRVSLDELVAKGRSVIGRIESAVRHVAGKLGRRP